VYDFAGGERVSYNAYGKQTITSATGAVRAKSAVGFDRGFTGYVADNETGLYYARARMFSPSLGRFIGRDPWVADKALPTSADGYVDGFSLYSAYFVPNGVDAMGTYSSGGSTGQTCDPPPVETKYCVYVFLTGDQLKTVGGVPAGPGFKICTVCPESKTCPYSGVSKRASLTYDDGTSGWNLEYTLDGVCVDCPEGAAKGKAESKDTRKWLFGSVKEAVK